MGALCIQCSVGDESIEFPTVRDLVDHQKGGHISRSAKKLPPSPKKGPSATEADKKTEEITVKPQATQEVVNTTPVKPLELRYKWMGIHTNCNSEVKTIEVDLGKTVMVIAYCIACDMKLGQMEVVPIKKQELKQDDTFERKIKGRK